MTFGSEYITLFELRLDELVNNYSALVMCLRSQQAFKSSEYVLTDSTNKQSKTDLRICVVNGAKVTEEVRKLADLNDDNWHPCPIPTNMGVPLMVKRIDPLLCNVDDEHQPAAFLMLGMENQDLFKPLGRLEFKRSDRIDLTSKLWWEIYDHIHYKLLQTDYCDIDIETAVLKNNSVEKQILERYSHPVDCTK
jgi:hypothetical protein